MKKIFSAPLMEIEYMAPCDVIATSTSTQQVPFLPNSSGPSDAPERKIWE